MKHFLLKAVVGLCVSAGVACSGDVQGEYTRHHAFFRYPNVNTTPELRTALGSPGMFCKITFPAAYYLFTDADGKFTQVNRTSLDAYGQPMFIAGFLVGTPSIPDFSGNFVPVAYDLACPNCFSESAIQRALDFTAPLEMKCGRCGREYDLNNSGVVTDGEKGRPLFRYRMSYAQAQGMLVIQN